MILETIKEKQPIIYRLLHNELNNNKLPHAFLISGNDMIQKKDLAILLAQSIIENNNDFACETCNTCNRVKNNKYLDYIYVDGTQRSIKKEEIESIQAQFSKQASEIANRKVYIINGIENTTIPGLNSLLKFLEEPNGETTYAILITNNINKLLPTIISRCQRLELKANNYNDLYNQYIKLENNSLKAHYLAHVLRYYDETMVNNEEFELAFEQLLEFKRLFKKDLDFFLYSIETSIFSLQDKTNELKIIKFLLNMIYIYCKDIILNTKIDNELYNKADYDININKLENIMFIILESLNMINNVYDHKLVFEALIFKIKGELE